MTPQVKSAKTNHSKLLIVTSNGVGDGYPTKTKAMEFCWQAVRFQVRNFLEYLKKGSGTVLKSFYGADSEHLAAHK